MKVEGWKIRLNKDTVIHWSPTTPEYLHPISVNVSIITDDKDNKPNRNEMKIVGGRWWRCDGALTHKCIKIVKNDKYET